MSDFTYYHQEEYNVIFANEAIETPIGRLSQVHLTKKTKERKDKKGKIIPGAYSVTLLLDKEDKKVKKFYKQIEEAVAEMKDLYNSKAEVEMGKVKKLFWDGDAGETEKYPHDKGMWKLVASVKDDLPQIFDRTGEEQAPEKVLSGLLGVLFVKIKFHAKGVSFGLEVVQTIEDDGVRLSSGKPDYKALLSHKKDAEATEEEDTEDEAEEEEKPVKKLKTKAKVEEEEEESEDEEADEEEEESDDEDSEEEDEEESDEEDEDADSDGDGEEDSSEDDDEDAPKKKGKSAAKVEGKKLTPFEKAKADQAARVAAKKSAVKSVGKGKAAGVALI